MLLEDIFSRKFFCLFLGQLLTHFGDAIIQVILVYIIMQNIAQPGSLIALMLFCFVFPALIISPLAGSLVDRFSRRKIMIISALYRGIVLVCASAFYSFMSHKTNLTTQIHLYGISLSLLIGIGTAFFYPAKMASVPNLVGLKSLKPANALIAGSGTWALTFGAFLASGIMLKAGVLNMYYTAVFTYFLSAVFLLFVTLKHDINSIPKENINIVKDIKLTIAFLNSHKKAFDMMFLAVILSLISATFYNAMNALATNTYHVSVQSLTMLKCMLGCGTFYGLIIMFVFGKYLKTNRVLVGAFLGLFLCLITISFCTTFFKARFWLAGIGIFATMLKVTIDTILQKVSPNFIRGKIFAFASMLETFVTLLGTAFVSLLVGIIKPIAIFHIIAIMSAFMAFLILALNRDFRYFVFRITFGQIFKILFNLQVEGFDNLPKSGKILLAGNYTGKLDFFVLQMASKRNLWIITNVFNLPLINKMLKWFNIIPIKKDIITTALTKLKCGEPVVIFQENDNLEGFKKQIVSLAKDSDCPLIPFAIKGKIFSKIIIQFGQPIKTEHLDDTVIANDISQRIRFLKTSLERRAFYKIKDTHYTNFLDIMKQYSDTYGQTKAVSLKTKCGYEEISYIELKRMAKTLGNYLIENADVQRGDRIAILCESRPEFAVGMFGSIQTGAITVPLDVKLTVPEHTHILSDCNPKILLCSSHYLEHSLELKNNVPSIKNIFVLDDEEREHHDIMSVSSMTADLTYSFNRARSMDDTALIVYTSGTTGNPKGVMISFGNIYSQMKDFEKIFKLSKDDTLLSILPLNHLLELNVGFFGMLFMGAKIVYIKSLNPKELTDAMREKQVTHMIVVPLVAKMLKNSIDKQIKKLPSAQKKMFEFMYKISKYMPLGIRRMMFKSIINGFGGKFKCFISGGAPLETNVAEFFERIGIPAFEGYGLTETSPVISTNEYKHHKIGTVGVPLPSVSVKLSEQGEILVSGPNVMQGYYNKPQMTSEIIDEEGWFHTGDIGEIDKKGFIKITGRIKNMIVLGGGKKIFPEEVEAVLEKSEIIKELCVLSLKIKSGNKAGTEEVGVIIVPNDELAKKTDSEIQKELENEVKRLANGNLADYKIPTMVVLHREPLPKTSTQKVKRKNLTEWYENL